MTRACVDCRFHKKGDWFAWLIGKDVHRCVHPEVSYIHPVSGEVRETFCSVERDFSLSSNCGWQGKLWEPKIPHPLD